MKKRKIGRWIFAALLSAALVLVFTGKDGLINIYRLHRKTERIEAEVRQMEAMIDSLEIEVDRLKNDTAYIERMAREKLGMAHEGEKVYKFIEENK